MHVSIPLCTLAAAAYTLNGVDGTTAALPPDQNVPCPLYWYQQEEDVRKWVDVKEIQLSEETVPNGLNMASLYTHLQWSPLLVKRTPVAPNRSSKQVRFLEGAFGLGSKVANTFHNVKAKAGSALKKAGLNFKRDVDFLPRQAKETEDSSGAILKKSSLVDGGQGSMLLRGEPASAGQEDRLVKRSLVAPRSSGFFSGSNSPSLAQRAKTGLGRLSCKSKLRMKRDTDEDVGLDRRSGEIVMQGSQMLKKRSAEDGPEVEGHTVQLTKRAPIPVGVFVQRTSPRREIRPIIKQTGKVMVKGAKLMAPVAKAGAKLTRKGLTKVLTRKKPQ